jgi:hypothetical protein
MAIKTELIEKELEKFNKNHSYSLTVENFVETAKRYIKAVNERRLMCNIESVSSSGLSRTMSFFEMRKNPYGNEYMVTYFFTLFDALGYKSAKKGEGYVIHGCGMDMVFATNYDIINKLYTFGLISKPMCKKLQNLTPHKV